MSIASQNRFEVAWGAHWNKRATRYEPCSNESSVALPGKKMDPVSNFGSAEPPTGDPNCTPFALLLDVSATGAMIALDEAPTPREPVWLRLGLQDRVAWREARVVGVTSSPRGPHLVRLAFLDPCPVEVLMDTVCGPN
jgi:hypothetical protein